MNRFFLILSILLIPSLFGRAEDSSPLTTHPLTPNPLTEYNLDDIILDIYRSATEVAELDYEQLQNDLYALHDAPIDLNATSEEELSLLPFLSPQQIDEILNYADKHPFESLYELQLLPSLTEYTIRDLLPFVRICERAPNSTMYAREVFHNAKHEILTRVDARNIEHFEGSDPIYFQTRYRFDYQRRVTFGLQLRRPVGGKANDLQYGAYLQLRDIGCLHTLVAGTFQASFGQGLVLAPVFHSGKSAYVQSIGQTSEGLRYYSSVDGEGLQGLGTTFRWNFNRSTRLDVSALYSIKRANDSTLHHLVGANMTLRYRKLQLQLTAVENIWSDSIHPYRNTTYNEHYFRGRNQAVLGASVRYNHGWFDAFAEFATTQNYKRFEETINSEASQHEVLNSSKWGFGAIAGSRFYPTSGVSLIASYRYYSPYFDNPLGYAFSETSRLGDENGVFVGFDLTRWKNWRINGYADVFYFSGYKYGIPFAPSWGYDALAEFQYSCNLQSPICNLQSEISNPQSQITAHPLTTHPLTINPLTFIFRLRARQKGALATYSARAQFDYHLNSWSFRTTAEANLTSQRTSGSINPQSSINSASSALNAAEPQYAYGYTLYQDFSYSIPIHQNRQSQITNSPTGDKSQIGNNQSPLTTNPLTLTLRLQFFDARHWANRIYTYEHDVLYAFSIPATYGFGGRAYLCLRWQIIPQLALYFRVSETIYAHDWYVETHPEWSSNSPTGTQSAIFRTDLHLLLRATL